jgi:hypothetical protein
LSTGFGYGSGLQNSALNRRSPSARPSCVSQTDLAFFRIADHTSVVQAIQGAPVEAFPGAALVVQRQIHQRQHGLVDPVLIDVHDCGPDLWVVFRRMIC